MSNLLLHIDGVQGSGSGTIVRYAVAFATLLGRPLHIVKVRSRRPQPGLQPQHWASVLACAELCRAHVEGVHVGAKEFASLPVGRREAAPTSGRSTQSAESAAVRLRSPTM